MVKSTGQRGTGQRYHHQITNRGGCTTNNLAILPIADIYRWIGFLPIELLDIGHRPTVTGPSTGPGDDLFDLVADAQQRLLEFAWGNVPAQRRPQPPRAASCRVAASGTTPNGNDRTSPSTMSRMSRNAVAENCRVRSNPIPNAKPE